MNNVAVTGSAGYIGSVLCDMLEEQGSNVLRCDIDAKTSGYWGSFDELEFTRMIDLHRTDTIYHLAATSLVGPDSEDPLLYMWNNTSRTTNFLHNLIQLGWQGHIIFASTAAVYASSVFEQPLTEKDRTDPLTVYGKSKLRCEEVLNMSTHYGMKVTNFRFFNVAGAHNDKGEELFDTHLLSRICWAALTGNPVTVYGNNYTTRDGTCIRDYVDVRDICRAQLFAAQNKVYGTYNLGTKHGLSVYEMIDNFNVYTGTKVHFKIGERRPGDLHHLTANSDLFIKQGFNYKYNLEQTITSTWEHFKRISTHGL